MNTLLPQAQQATNTKSDQRTADQSIASFDAVEYRKLFHELTMLASFCAFHLLALLGAAHLHTLLTTQPAVSNNELDEGGQVFNVAHFLSAYFDAYFRGGQFLQVSFDQNDFVAALATRIKHQLPKPGKAFATTDEIAALLQSEFEQPDEHALSGALPRKMPNGDGEASPPDETCTGPGKKPA